MTSETSPSFAKTAVRHDFHRKPRRPDLAAGWNRAEPRYEDVRRRWYSGRDPSFPHQSLHASPVGARPPRGGSIGVLDPQPPPPPSPDRSTNPVGRGTATAAVLEGRRSAGHGASATMA
ncbi:DNA-directed RNA polymerase III subunit RPC1 [Hordeum vulgare]|nr:DNA-directed RNA polymerase III subunit RPC1 [Hordeum vulgare]